MDLISTVEFLPNLGSTILWYFFAKSNGEVQEMVKELTNMRTVAGLQIKT